MSTPPPHPSLHKAVAPATPVLPGAVSGAVPQQHPVVVFVAGQAGSGKTLVMDMVPRRP
ncbi:zeta toxin family protein [Streptomyces sp. NBC_00829]|uniref:zeta toxin family protein n=1 Tax=Streptomyces sp. NBC_00829 TaxID=2903679 RepID=UPI0038641797|nr:zeta toxin family protein [Streptomyces sp. NBC_00829]